MKTNTTLRDALGVSQQEMAMILGITYSQYSMFELGLRDIPLRAKEQLAEMVLFLQSEKKQAKPRAKKSPGPSEHIRRQVDALLSENNYKQLTLSRKVAVFELQQQTVLKREQLAAHLASRANNGTRFNLDRLVKSQSVESKNLADGRRLGFELKLAVLAFEKQWLEERLKSADAVL